MCINIGFISLSIKICLIWIFFSNKLRSNIERLFTVKLNLQISNHNDKNSISKKIKKKKKRNKSCGYCGVRARPCDYKHGCGFECHLKE